MAEKDDTIDILSFDINVDEKLGLHKARGVKAVVLSRFLTTAILLVVILIPPRVSPHASYIYSLARLLYGEFAESVRGSIHVCRMLKDPLFLVNGMEAWMWLLLALLLAFLLYAFIVKILEFYTPTLQRRRGYKAAVKTISLATVIMIYWFLII